VFSFLKTCSKVCAEFIVEAGRLNAMARRIAPAGCNLIRTTNWRLGYTTSLKSSKNWSWSRRTTNQTTTSQMTTNRMTTNRMTTNQTNRNSRSLKYRPTSLSRCRSWRTTIRSYGQSCGDAKSRNCPRCGYRRHRNLHGARRFRRHHAWADYVRPVAAFVVAEFLAALCTAAYLDIFRPDSNHRGGNSGCRMSCFAAVQP